MKIRMNIAVNQFVTFAALGALVLLAGCSMPEKPAGADQEGFSIIGDQLMQRGDINGAVNFYQRVLQKNPRDADTRLKLLSYLESQNDVETVRVGYEEGLKYNSDHTGLLRGYGKYLLRAGRSADAKEQFERAYHVDSSDARNVNGLGVTLDLLGQHEEAQKLYLEILDDTPDDIATLNNLGHSYVLSGRVDDAIKLLEPHANNPKATAALRQNLAEAYGLAGMDTDAERIGLMDLKGKDVKHNMTVYKQQRKELALAPSLFADLGSFPTNEVAQAHTESVKAGYGYAGEALVYEIVPLVSKIGGTPKFTIYVKGFTQKQGLVNYCARLKKGGIQCKVSGS